MVASIRVSDESVRVGREIRPFRFTHHEVVGVYGHGLEVTYTSWHSVPWRLDELEDYRVRLYVRVFKNRVRRFFGLPEKELPPAGTVLIRDCLLRRGTDEEEERDERWLLDNDTT